MRVLGLDMSTKTGYSIIGESGLEGYGLVCVDRGARDGLPPNHIEDYGFVADADQIAAKVGKIVAGKNFDYVYIEQTNKGRARTTQKQLEFIHFAVLRTLAILGYKEKVRYVDTSAWRSRLKVKMSKDDSKHNKLVRNRLARGKITTKHLAVRWANEKYGLELKLKDNDIADAIAVATYGHAEESKQKPNVTAKQIEEIFKKS